jgi:hypothetical protein
VEGLIGAGRQPCSRRRAQRASAPWRGAGRLCAVFAYGTNCVIDTQWAIIVDVEATLERRGRRNQAEVGKNPTMLWLGRKLKLASHQRKEAIQRRDRGYETLLEIARSYNVSYITICQLQYALDINRVRLDCPQV